MISVNGITIAIIELSAFASIAYPIRKYVKTVKHIEAITYYWLAFTILTGIWEVCFIGNYHNINNISQALITNKEHVWTNNYTLDYVLPWKLSNIFYAEYGAWADREYMVSSNYWSRLIEGSHAFLCGLFSLLGMISRVEFVNKKYLVCMVLAMGTQLMNSILYMGQYFLQTQDPNNINYNNSSFPTGVLLTKRGFMYVNVFWTLLPSYVLYKTLTNKKNTVNDSYHSNPIIARLNYV
jgi:hypothetical protein